MKKIKIKEPEDLSQTDINNFMIENIINTEIDYSSNINRDSSESSDDNIDYLKKFIDKANSNDSDGDNNNNFKKVEKLELKNNRKNKGNSNIKNNSNTNRIVDVKTNKH